MSLHLETPSPQVFKVFYAFCVFLWIPDLLSALKIALKMSLDAENL